MMPASLQSAFGLDMPAGTPKDALVVDRPVSAPLIGAIALLAALIAASALVPERKSIKPPREGFSSFPLSIGEWRGRLDKLEQVYQDILKADDTLIGDYRLGGDAVNLYIQYYGAQVRGAGTHSPRLCIPGGGWEIVRIEDRELSDVLFRGTPLRVNRSVITRGESALLVYYWFQQRGRNSTNEYATKWLIFWDSLTRHRSDGSMVRIITAPRPGEPIERADERLTAFARALLPQLPPFIPE